MIKEGTLLALRLLPNTPLYGGVTKGRPLQIYGSRPELFVVLGCWSSPATAYARRRWLRDPVVLPPANGGSNVQNRRYRLPGALSAPCPRLPGNGANRRELRASGNSRRNGANLDALARH